MYENSVKGRNRFGHRVHCGLASVGTLLVLSGCAPPRMAAPADLNEKAVVLEVKDRGLATGAFVDESFKLGPFKVTDIDRDWDSKSGFSAGPWAKSTATTGFTYALADGSRKVRGKCMSERKTQSVTGTLGTIEWRNVSLACECGSKLDPSTLVLSKQQQRMTIRGADYRLTPIHEVEGGGSSMEPSGFRADGEDPFGAVEVVHPGRVWLTKNTSTDERESATCLFAGLMLYRPPSD